MDARYEHSSFRCNEYDFGAIYVYGGAHRGSSHGNVQVCSHGNVQVCSHGNVQVCSHGNV